MANQLNQQLSQFLKHHIAFEKPVLLGYSGGPDSVAMLHLLLACQKEMPFKLGIAHIDHGWRTESADEAFSAQKVAEEHQLPFHLLKLKPTELRARKGNLEAVCRQERLAFFRSLSQEFGYQGVILAHHADDQAETVLKRVLEGSALIHLKGLQPVSEIEGLKLFRPLLSFTKTALLDYVTANHLHYFQDKTNNDPTYLRGKFRTQIIPELSHQFGKAIHSSLLSLGDESAELNSYMQERLQSYFAYVNRGWMGTHIDLNTFPNAPAYEIKYLIKHLCQHDGFLLQRPLMEAAYQLLKQGLSNKWLANGQGRLFIDRGHLFILKNQQDSLLLPQSILLEPGKYHTGNLHIVVDHFDEISKKEKNSSWLNVWLGRMETLLPIMPHILEMPAESITYPGTHSISKWWNSHKVPVLLRQAIPVIKDVATGLVVHEFLSGRTQYKGNKPSYHVRIEIKREIALEREQIL